jgi:hypothetical protein
MDQVRVGKWPFFEQPDYKAIYLLNLGDLAFVVEYARMLYLRWRMVTIPLNLGSSEHRSLIA